MEQFDIVGNLRFLPGIVVLDKTGHLKMSPGAEKLGAVSIFHYDLYVLIIIQITAGENDH